MATPQSPQHVAGAAGRITRWVLHSLRAVCAVGVLAVDCTGAWAQADPAAALRAKYQSLQERLQHSAFHEPLVLESTEAGKTVAGDVHAVLNHPFALVRDNLSDPQHWCDILILHINTKYCHTVAAAEGPGLRVRVGRKTPEELGSVPRIELKFRPTAVRSQYVGIALEAADGPMDTTDYRIFVEAIALDDGKTFLHLSYSYANGLLARLAMRAYLATVGSGKLGFTQAGQRADGQPSYVGGVRGVVERNTMRYYLAIDSFMAAASLPPEQQAERRLQYWFTAVERYALQLHEMEQRDYLAMKRDEVARQRVLQ